MNHFSPVNDIIPFVFRLAIFFCQSFIAEDIGGFFYTAGRRVYADALLIQNIDVFVINGAVSYKKSKGKNKIFFSVYRVVLNEWTVSVERLDSPKKRGAQMCTSLCVAVQALRNRSSNEPLHHNHCCS